MVKKLDPELIQKFKALDNIVINGGENILRGAIVDRDLNPRQFEAIVRSGGRWSLPGTKYADSKADLIVEERRTSSELSSEVWVSPDGSDDNDGTRGEPFASIQYAIDTLVERVGHNARKVVNLTAGPFDIGTVIMYTKNLHIIGQGGNLETQRDPNAIGGSTRLNGDSTSTPAFVISPMSKTSVEDWITEGGFSHSIVTNTYSYTGAALTGREEAYPATPSDPTFYASNCSIENVTIFDAGPIVVIGIGTASISGVYFKNVKNFGGFAAKNARSLLVSNSSFTLGDPILDNVGQVFIDKKEYEDSNLLGVNTVVVNTDTRDSLIEFGAAAAYVKAAIAVYGGGTMTAVGGRVNSLTMFNSSTLVAELFSVMGNVDLTGALSVTWKGGSFYGTKTDPGNLLGTAAAGDYLNI